MAVKATTKKKSTPTLGAAVVVYTKSSSHWLALTDPSIVSIEGIAFLQGTQVTGKVGHRMEGKRTLVPCDHIASIIEFPSEEDIWSEPQAKLLRPPEEPQQSTLLTSHEQPGQGHPQPKGQGHHGHRRHRNRNRGGKGGGQGGQDGRFGGQGGVPRDQGFRR